MTHPSLKRGKREVICVFCGKTMVEFQQFWNQLFLTLSLSLCVCLLLLLLFCSDPVFVSKGLCQCHTLYVGYACSKIYMVSWFGHEVLTCFSLLDDKLQIKILLKLNFLFVCLFVKCINIYIYF